MEDKHQAQARIIPIRRKRPRMKVNLELKSAVVAINSQIAVEVFFQ